jgi:lipoprotein NlpI
MQLRPDAYGVLWLDIARRHAGQDDKAELARNVGRLIVPDRWPAPIAAFYLGKTSREAVYAAANEGGDDTARLERLCQADFYTAENELSNGVHAGAHALLQRAVDRCPPHFFEGWAARAELARLGR